MITIRIGNPFIKTETEPEDIQRYNKIVETLKSHKGITDVYVLTDRLEVYCDGKKKTYKYTKKSDFDWLIGKLENVESAVEKQKVRESVPSHLWKICDEVKRIIKDGGRCSIVNGIFVVEYKTFKGCIDLNNRAYNAMPAFTDRLKELTRHKSEYDKLVEICKKKGINV